MSAESAALGFLFATFPRPPVEDRTVAAYARLLADVPEEELLLSVERLCKTARFLPTPGDIRRDVAERLLDLPLTAEAEEQFQRMGASSGLSPHPLVYRAARAVGDSWDWREHGHRLLGPAVKNYAERRASAIQEATAGDLGALAALESGGVRAIALESDT